MWDGALIPSRTLSWLMRRTWISILLLIISFSFFLCVTTNIRALRRLPWLSLSCMICERSPAGKVLPDKLPDALNEGVAHRQARFGQDTLSSHPCLVINE